MTNSTESTETDVKPLQIFFTTVVEYTGLTSSAYVWLWDMHGARPQGQIRKTTNIYIYIYTRS